MRRSILHLRFKPWRQHHRAFSPTCCLHEQAAKDHARVVEQVADELTQQLRQVLWQFKAPIRYAFAYGSGVFPQRGYAKQPTRKPMVDYIFGVNHAQHFHSLNLTDHADHYSFLRRFGSGTIAHVQERYGAGVYFNPYVTVNGIAIKYGIVNLETLCDDLDDWHTLYLAGRMQKPVKVLRDHPKVQIAQQRNLNAALRTALLLLPERFTERALFTTIASLSYLGDPRMSVGGENPKKVENIVSAQQEHFRALYGPLLADLPNVQYLSTHDIGQDMAPLLQDLDSQTRGNMVRRMPKMFKTKLYNGYRRILGEAHVATLLADAKEPIDSSSSFGSPFDAAIASSPLLPAQVTKTISATVAWPSTIQSVKGILTAGPLKSWNYVAEKLQKAKKLTTKESFLAPLSQVEQPAKSTSSSTAAAIRDSVRQAGSKTRE
jgi:translocator assembly and maintenance protein 41